MDSKFDLPEMCYGMLLDNNELIVIKHLETGYYPMVDGPVYTTKEAVRKLNEGLGVTPAQAEAMSVGSMFGWDVPGANPNMYDENGNWK